MQRLFLTFLLCLCAVGVQAQCYSPSQARAEQLLRVHSELMVIGLNCTNERLSNGMSAYEGYKDFTNRHAGLIGYHEDVLQGYFAASGNARPDRAVHDLRTALANDVSKDASRRPDGFCSAYLPRIQFARSLDGQQFEQWATRYPVSRPVCR